MKVGDSILVCDAGGGTVDLVTYRIKRLPPDLQVEESGLSSGGKCGSVFLNRIFENWVDTELGEGNRLSKASRAHMMHHFETVTKRDFDVGEEADVCYQECLG